MMEHLVNIPVTFPFVSTNNQTGITSFSPIILKDGAPTSVSPSFSEIGSGLYTGSFTPAVTGQYTVFIEGSIQAEIKVVSKTYDNQLHDISGAVLGSWQWDKLQSTLILYDEQGSELASYKLNETDHSASRELQG